MNIGGCMSFESLIQGRELNGSPSVCTWKFVVVIDCGRQQQIIWVRSHVLLVPNSKGCCSVIQWGSCHMSVCGKSNSVGVGDKSISFVAHFAMEFVRVKCIRFNMACLHRLSFCGQRPSWRSKSGESDRWSLRVNRVRRCDRRFACASISTSYVLVLNTSTT